MKRLIRRLQGEGLGAVLARGAAGSFLIKGAAAFAGFGMHLALARIQGPESYGIFTLVFTWTVVLASLSRVGLERTILRFISSYRATRAWNALAGILGQVRTWVWSISITVACAVTAAIWLWPSDLSREIQLTVTIGMITLPFIAWIGLQESALAAFQRPVISGLPFNLVRPIVTIAAGLMAYHLTGELSADVSLACAGLGVLVGFGFATIALRWIKPPELASAIPDKSARSEWMTVAFPLFFVAAMNTAGRRTDLLLIAGLSGSEDVGFFTAAVRYTDLLLFAQQSVSVLATPMFAGLFAEDRRSDLQRIVRLSTLAAAAFAAPLGIGLILFGGPLLGLFGEEFVSARVALVWLTLGQLTNTASGLVGALLTMTGHQATVARVATASAGLNILLNFVLIPRYGITGAAIANAISIAMLNVTMAILVRKRLGIDSTVFGIFGLLRRDPRANS